MKFATATRSFVIRHYVETKTYLTLKHICRCHFESWAAIEAVEFAFDHVMEFREIINDGKTKIYTQSLNY